MDYNLFILIAAAPFIMAGAFYLVVLKMSQPEKMLRPIPGGLGEARQKVILLHRDWLAARGFQYLTSFRFGRVDVAVFQEEGSARFFCFNFVQSWNFDLVTHFDGNSDLTTSSSDSIGMLPLPPGTYKQGFPHASADVIWQRHMEAEEFLKQKFGLTPEQLTTRFEQFVLDGIREQIRFVRSIPFWPFRALYWFAVTRKRIANRSILQRFT